jgi:hypothetical protein
MNGREAMRQNLNMTSKRTQGAGAGSELSNLSASWMTLMAGGEGAAKAAACAWSLLGRRGSANLALARKVASTRNPSELWNAYNCYCLEMDRDLRVGAAEVWRSLFGHGDGGQAGEGAPPKDSARRPRISGGG